MEVLGEFCAAASRLTRRGDAMPTQDLPLENSTEFAMFLEALDLKDSWKAIEPQTDRGFIRYWFVTALRPGTHGS